MSIPESFGLQSSWTNIFQPGVCTLEYANDASGPWQCIQNFFATNQTDTALLPHRAPAGFFRILSADVSTNSPDLFGNLAASYGLLTTVAGNGFGGIDGTNYWQSSFEGGFATNAALSRPHFAMADVADNLLIVDKDSHSVLMVTPDGRIHTVAGTHIAGDNGDGPAPATQLHLNSPNGLWVRPNGIFYILDSGNGKIRRVENGTMTTIYSAKNPISGGRGLWVSDDESIIYFCAGNAVKKRAAGNTTTLNNNFTDLGNIIVDPNGDIVATDRGANKVYLLDATGGNAGTRNRLFGSGNAGQAVEGMPADTSSLYGVRGIWPFPTGGYLLATHEGSQLLYVDAAGIVHVMLNGTTGNVHAGDGQWFAVSGPPKIAEARSVTMERHGDIFVVENDSGFVRKIRFLRLTP